MERGTLQELQLRHMKKMEALASKSPQAPSQASAVVAAAAVADTAMSKRPVHPNVLRQQYDVVSFLMDTRRAVSTDEIHASLGINLSAAAHKPLLQALMQNERVAVDPVSGIFSYRPAHAVHSEDELVELVGHFPDGIDGEELRDSYPHIADDIAKAVAARRILGIRSRDKALPLLFPNTQSVSSGAATAAVVVVSQEIREMWNAVKLPDDIEIEQQLRTIGLLELPMAGHHQSQSAAASSSGKRRGRGGKAGGGAPRKRSRKVTNTHLLDQEDLL